MTVTSRHYKPRDYKVVKACLPGGVVSFLVVSVDLVDPDVWVVINRFESARDAWRYVSQVKARNMSIAEEVGCVVRALSTPGSSTENPQGSRSFAPQADCESMAV